MVPEFQFITDSFRKILYVKKFHLESLPKVENDVRKKEKNKWISVFPLPHSITLALLVVCLSVLLCDYNILLMFHLITKPYFSYEIKIDAYFFMCNRLSNCSTNEIPSKIHYESSYVRLCGVWILDTLCMINHCIIYFVYRFVIMKQK